MFMFFSLLTRGLRGYVIRLPLTNDKVYALGIGSRSRCVYGCRDIRGTADILPRHHVKPAYRYLGLCGNTHLQCGGTYGSANENEQPSRVDDVFERFILICSWCPVEMGVADPTAAVHTCSYILFRY